MKHLLAFARFLGLAVLILIIGLGVWAVYVCYWTAMWVSCWFHKDWETFYISWKNKLFRTLR